MAASEFQAEEQRVRLSHSMPSIQGKLSSAFFALGALILASGLIVNPWSGTLYRRRMINYEDAMLGYFISAVAIGLVVVGCGSIFRITRSGRIQNVTILIVTCLLIVLSDRLVLAMLGLPLWMTDLENHYQHRPNVVRSWGGPENKLIRINQYGHHDDDFPVQKPVHEFRGLMLGDSITMGHGVTHQETFSNQLENMLRERAGGAKTYQIINTGVQGYSTHQEYNMLLRSLAFKPDFIAIGFCMNDLTEPFVVDKRFGGVGIDYHHVAHASSMLTGYLFNETGYGRGIQGLRSLRTRLDRRKLWEANSVRKIAQSPGDPRFTENWKMVLSYLDKIYHVGRRENIRVVLLIFPFTFQLMNEELKNAQKILTEHATAGKVDVIDLTAVFEKEIFDPAGVSALREKGFSDDEIHARYRPRIKKYFFDADHFTSEGHRVVASRLLEYLSSRYSL